MSITNKIEKFHKNRVKSIKSMNNGIDKDLAISEYILKGINIITSHTITFTT